MKKIFLFILFLFLFHSKAYAAELDISVSPPILDISALPPSQVNTSIKLQNMNENAHDFEILIMPFRQSSSKNGTVEYEDLSVGPNPFLREKIKLLDGSDEISSIHLGPLETKDLTLKIDIERSTQKGEHYFSIVFMSKDEQKDKSSKIPSGIATNVLLSIGTKGATLGSIERFTSPFLFEHGSVPFELILKNESDHFILPNGNVTLKNIFGQTVGKVDILSQYVLSNTQRYLSDKSYKPSGKKPSVIWPETKLLGIYTATANIALSKNGPVLQKQIILIAFPFIPALITSLALIIIIGIYLRVRKLI